MAWRLYDYWMSKHLDGKPPSRGDIVPFVEIPKLLPCLFLLNIEGDTFRFRLVGSEIVSRAGRDSTGHLIDEKLLSASALDAWLRIMRKVANEQVPAFYCFDPNARTTHNALGLLLPLVGADGRTEMLMGGLFFGEAPRAAVRPHVPNRVYEVGFPERLTA